MSSRKSVIDVIHTRQRLEALEDQALAPYGTRSRDSRGRAYPEDEPTERTVFQRDRDRILHTTAFRRLEYKTQVFVNYEGDYYRTRLTHTLEVAQIGRTLARALGANEDLVEAVCLAHDLGHPPFGHAGEAALARLMADHGGFDHNRQSLRIVTELEHRFPEFPGLNLTWEVREGIVKHETEYDMADAAGYDPEKRGSSRPSWRTWPTSWPTPPTTWTTDCARRSSSPDSWRVWKSGRWSPPAWPGRLSNSTSWPGIASSGA
jgi:dGTPase